MSLANDLLEILSSQLEQDAIGNIRARLVLEADEKCVEECGLSALRRQALLDRANAAKAAKATKPKAAKPTAKPEGASA